MADYWKSQERKYCDFCKCWVADNKPSIEFHEKGRRHKENVSKRLKAIHKKAKREEKETVRIDNVLQHMESAALEAYRKDIELNADLTSVTINKKIKGSTSAINSSKKLWHEEKSRSGQVSYRNILTNETVWEPPSEGYLTVAEQKLASLQNTKNQLNLVRREQQIQGRVRYEELKRQDEEERARLAREKMKERRAEPEVEPVYAPLIPPGPSTPYGQWQTVKQTEVQEIDWQLPQQEEYQFSVPEPEPEPAPKEFKEKVVESLGSGSTGFKKRKIGSVAKGNRRQRLNDD